MNALPSLVRGLRAISRGRLFTRPASHPTLHDVVEESPEAEAVIEQTPPGGIEPEELLALDRKLENVLRKNQPGHARPTDGSKVET